MKAARNVVGLPHGSRTGELTNTMSHDAFTVDWPSLPPFPSVRTIRATSVTASYFILARCIRILHYATILDTTLLLSFFPSEPNSTTISIVGYARSCTRPSPKI